MEETDVRHLTPTVLFVQQSIPHGCAAKRLAPSQRLTLGLHALAGTQSISGLANELDVSRKFVYQQAATAQTALDDAFLPSAATDDQVLFLLPVTKNWLRQVALSLTLICHSSYRGVVEFCRDLLDVPLSVGWVHNIVHAAIDKARPYNSEANLAQVAYAGLDEIYQHRQPVFVAADIESTYCFLLSSEDHCDGDTWAIRLLEAQERGLAPQAVVSDFGSAIHGGLKLAMPDIPHRGDVFHGLAAVTEAATFLETRAHQMIAAHHKLQLAMDKMKKQGRPASVLSRKLVLADQAQVKAIDLADHIALLGRWLRDDVFAVSGLPYADRCTLFDFVLAELQVRAPLYPKQLAPLCTMLQNHREQLLAFAAKLDQDLVRLATQFEVSATVVRDMLDFDLLDDHQTKRWQKEDRLRHQLRSHFCTLQKAVHDLAQHVVRASSVIENINSRLRSYFCLRREIGSDYLVLLQFFLNQRRFLRSERPERVGKSPAELLTGHSHPHWLEMLGYTRFSQN
jgi:hypothetical protein